jgi:hypothetical protein
VELLSKVTDAVEDYLEGVAEIVNDNDVIVGLEQLQGGMASNETQTTGDEDMLVL